jgi:superfamily II DNA/RNA helicase
LSDTNSPDFNRLDVHPLFIEGLAGRGITTPSEIQKQVIPALASGENLLFISATGTGITFAYLLPLLATLLKHETSRPQRAGGPRVVVCAPTYELCSQIKQEVDFLLSFANRAASGGAPDGVPPPLTSCLIIGSAQMGRQVETLKAEKPAVIVGNPGRLLLLSRMGKLKFRELESLVLDEGDRLVSDELIEETGELIKLIHSAVPKDRGLQTVACSATFSAKARDRLLPLMGGAVRTVESGGLEVLRDQVEHWAIFSEDRQKIGTLCSLIAAIDKGKKGIVKALIFTARGNHVENIAAQLQHRKLAAAGLWGGMEKKARKAAVDGFRSGSIRFLVTSDLAARGLDINDVGYIIALDTGEDQGAYIHRAGRTARAGKRGVMITIGSEADLRRLSKLEKNLGIIVYPKELYGGKIAAPSESDEIEA